MYIRYHEAEKLFMMYPTLQSILKSLELNLQCITQGEEIDEEINSLIMGNKRLDGIIPTTGNVSDSTGNLAVKMPVKQKILAKELSKDIIKLSMIIQKINLAITKFSGKQTIIMQCFYWGEDGERLPWKQIIRKFNPKISLRNAKDERVKGLNKIVSISKITLEDYNWVIDLIDGNDKN